MRAMLAMATLMALAGCNMVISEKPWFAAGDPSVRLADGLWVMEKPDCRFDPAAALPAWPECAQPLFVRGSAFLTPPDNRDPDAPKDRHLDVPLERWESTVPVLAGGDPIIVQLHLESNPKSDDSIAIPPDQLPYLYLAMRAAQRDPDGTLRAMRMWPVFCGPPPAKVARDKASSPDRLADETFTSAPFPGIRRAETGCNAESVDALRGAAGKSEAVAAANGVPPIDAHWLRAGL